MSNISKTSKTSTSRLQDLKHVTFLGGGAMGNALAQGLIVSGILPKTCRITISDPYIKSNVSIKYPNIVTMVTDNIKAIQHTNIIFLCVKPNMIDPVLKEISSYLNGQELIISIAAGITIRSLQSSLSSSSSTHISPLKKKLPKILRLMPNTPALVNAMAAGLCANSEVSKEDIDFVIDLLTPLGVIKYMHNESYMDAVTGLSGSGPAFVFLMIEALADGGVQAGLTRADALALATQTVFGSAKMVQESQKHPGELKDQVASPAGTTMAGIKALEKHAFRYAVISAVEEAAKRSREFSKL